MIDVRKKLQDELNVIERELRVDLPKEILRAREHGDLSENAEYKSAKERQSFLEGRKAQLHQRLAALLLVNLDKIPTDRAAYGSKVVLYDYETEKEVEYQLVSPEESNLNKGLISITSPIGRSIVGKMVGDSIEIVTPSGRKDYEMRSLRTIHEMEE
jgi:transcription elongation factor GreA